MNPRIESELERVISQIVAGPRLAVIGSTQFWDAGSPALCEAIARELAAIEQLVALTGGMDGVGQTFAEAYEAARRSNGLPVNLYHLLPRGSARQDSGTTLIAGGDFHERREILGLAAQIYLVIEGGPGTEHEAAVAVSRGVAMIPVGRSGGHARELHAALKAPCESATNDWELLASSEATCDAVAAAVARLVKSDLERDDKQ